MRRTDDRNEKSFPRGVPSETNLSIETGRPDDGVVEVRISGELGTATAPLLDAVLASAQAQRPARIDVDVAEAWFADPAGLLVLIMARRRLGNAGARLAVHGPPGLLRRAFAATGLNRVFAVDELAADAAASSPH